MLSIQNKRFTLNEKQILFIGIGFYDYDNIIKNKLEDLGAKVTYININKEGKFLSFLKLFKLKIFFKKLHQKKLYNNLHKTSSNQDYVFIIKGDKLTQSHIDLIKSKNKNAKFILYFWDDIERIKNKKLLLKEFSNIWSFDKKDCENYNLKFRPLFFREQNYVINKPIFLSGIGAWHSNRIDLFRKYKNILNELGHSYYLKLYIGKYKYIIERYVKFKIKKEDLNLITKKPIPYSNVNEIMKNSKFILDIPHISQNGLTIRTIEALANNCHILTTNTNISTYKELPNNKFSIISNNPKEDIYKFLNNNFEPKAIEKEILNKFSIESFISDMFSDL